MKKTPQRYTIQIFYQARTDEGKPFRATSVYHTLALDVGQAYKNAEKVFGDKFKFGACLLGHHLRIP